MAFFGGEQHQAQHVPLAEDGRRRGRVKSLVIRADGKRHISPALLVNAALLHELLHLGREGAANEIPLAGAGGGNDAVPVGDNGRQLGGPGQGVAELSGKVLQPANERILLKNDLAVPGGEDLQGVTLADTHGAADLFGDHHAAQVV